MHLLTYAVARGYKTGNISETVEDRAKVTINGLYKVAHGLSVTVCRVVENSQMRD